MSNGGSKPRIAFICDGIAEFMAGSVESTRRFTRLLKNRGHHIVFIAGRAPEHRKDDTWENMRVYRFASLLLPYTDGHLYLGFPRTRQIKQILQKERIDILHIVVPTPAAIAAVYAARSLNIPVVVHSHTQPENLFLNAFHGRFIWLVDFLSATLYAYLHWLYKKVDILIFPSEFSRQLFKGLPPHVQTAVISNGVDRAKFRKQDPAPFYQKFKLAPDKKYLLYVGRLHPEKQVDMLIRAMPSILAGEPAAHALIVGGGHREESLKALAKTLNIEKQVSFLGRLSDEDVERAYTASAAFVLPSLVELEGMVVLQAMACGVPLLIANSPNSASPYFVKDNGFLFDPKNPEDLAEKALKLLTDEALRQKMAEESFKVGAQYDIEKGVEKIERIYTELLAARYTGLHERNPATP